MLAKGGWFPQMNHNAEPSARMWTVSQSVAPRAIGAAELRAMREPESTKTGHRSVVFAPPESYA